MKKFIPGGSGERDGGVEVLGVDGHPVLDDLGRGLGLFECPGGKRARWKEGQGNEKRTQDHPLRDPPPW